MSRIIDSGSSHQRGRYARLLLGILIGAAGLGWAGYGVNWAQVSHTFTRISLPGLAAALGCVLGVAVAKTIRWGALYRATHCYPAWGRLFAVLLAAQAVNLLIPIRVGEVIRIALMKRAGTPVSLTLLTIIVEKTLDLLTTGLVALTLAALALAPAWLRQPGRDLLVMGLVLVAGLVLIGQLHRRFGHLGVGHLLPPRFIPDRWRQALIGAIQRILGGLALLADWRSLAPVIFWHLVIWLLSLLTMLCLLAAFNLPLPLAAAVVLMLAVSASNIAPSPPALIGVIPGLAVVVLSQYGVDHAVAFGFGIVLNMVTVIPPVLLGLAAFLAYSGPIINLLHRPKSALII